MRYVVSVLTIVACFGFVSETSSQRTDLARTGTQFDRSMLLYGPTPVYPFEARRLRLVGSGVVALEVDKETGYVKSARVEKSTGHKILDDAAFDAYKRWRFNPRNWQRLMEQAPIRSKSKAPSKIWKVRIPVTFTMAGAKQ